jgi:flagellar protein FlaJ
LKARLKIINDAMPDLLSNASGLKGLNGNRKVASLAQINIPGVNESMVVTIKDSDKNKFMKELEISEGLIKKIRKKSAIEVEKNEEYQKSRGYVKYSNKLFLATASNLVKKGYFRTLVSDVNKANIGFLAEVYISTMFFSTLVAMIASFVFMIFLLFFKLVVVFPFVISYSGDVVSRLIKVIWVPIIITIGTFFFMYTYPSSEKKSNARRIEQELPFAVIHMSAVAGSGIEPVQIFKIIGLSKEYPFLRVEIRKVMNQINIYGYDLVTALNNVQKNTSSQKLSELLSGMGTTISSGGNLSEFFAKRAETLLTDYRLEREKYTKVAETFMDIYISVVIAAPMILMLVVVMMSLSGLNLPFTPGEINIITIAAIALINLVFLMFLRFKQPIY